MQATPTTSSAAFLATHRHNTDLAAAIAVACLTAHYTVPAVQMPPTAKIAAPEPLQAQESIESQPAETRTRILIQSAPNGHAGRVGEIATLVSTSGCRGVIEFDDGDGALIGGFCWSALPDKANC